MYSCLATSEGKRTHHIFKVVSVTQEHSTLKLLLLYDISVSPQNKTATHRADQFKQQLSRHFQIKGWKIR